MLENQLITIRYSINRPMVRRLLRNLINITLASEKLKQRHRPIKKL